MKNKSKFCRFLLGGAFIVSLLALGSCLMPDLKPELYFSSSRGTPVEGPPDSGDVPPDSGDVPPDSGDVPPDSGDVPPDSGDVPPATEAGPKFSTVPNFSTVPGGYTGPALITYYNPAATLNVTVTAAGTLEYDDSLTVPAGSVKSIELAGKKHLIGRAAPGAVSPIVLKLDTGGELSFRQPAPGGVPIGSYAEFQLIMINSDSIIMGASYKQEADLDLMNEPWEPVGSQSQPFTGIYDGGGKTLSNLKIEKTGVNNVGLFGVVDGEVRKVGIVSGSVKGKDNTGGIAGLNYGTIFASYNKAVVNGADNVGGVAGAMQSGGAITACYNKAAVNGADNVGGVAGNVQNGTITAVYNTGAVNGAYYVGGVTGLLNITISACYNTGMVTAVNFQGGVIGRTTGSSLAPGEAYWDKSTATGEIGDPSWMSGYSEYDGGDGFKPAWTTGDGTGGNYWKPGTVAGKDGVSGTTTPYPLPQLWFE
ncbi:hypothetical protein AGMMS49546_08250 [Spirochaetia bacterium]|nr:hypothetical protein AGMMS49546_08250 [Spirochaetia bacterium]